jgi:hypothetical protein
MADPLAIEVELLVRVAGGEPIRIGSMELTWPYTVPRDIERALRDAAREHGS